MTWKSTLVTNKYIRKTVSVNTSTIYSFLSFLPHFKFIHFENLHLTFSLTFSRSPLPKKSFLFPLFLSLHHVKVYRNLIPVTSFHQYIWFLSFILSLSDLEWREWKNASKVCLKALDQLQEIMLWSWYLFFSHFSQFQKGDTIVRVE